MLRKNFVILVIVKCWNKISGVLVETIFLQYKQLLGVV